MSKRIIFTFDDSAVDSLDSIQARHRYKSKGEVIRTALSLMQALSSHADKGFTDVLLKNPKSGSTRHLILPFIKS
jgi:Arc/MetJ-type ribon-helix-helix transcriptional regulator